MSPLDSEKKYDSFNFREEYLEKNGASSEQNHLPRSISYSHQHALSNAASFALTLEPVDPHLTNDPAIVHRIIDEKFKAHSTLPIYAPLISKIIVCVSKSRPVAKSREASLINVLQENCFYTSLHRQKVVWDEPSKPHAVRKMDKKIIHSHQPDPSKASRLEISGSHASQASWLTSISHLLSLISWNSYLDASVHLVSSHPSLSFGAYITIHPESAEATLWYSSNSDTFSSLRKLLHSSPSCEDISSQSQKRDLPKIFTRGKKNVFITIAYLLNLSLATSNRHDQTCPIVISSVSLSGLEAVQPNISPPIHSSCGKWLQLTLRGSHIPASYLYAIIEELRKTCPEHLKISITHENGWIFTRHSGNLLIDEIHAPVNSNQNFLIKFL